MENIMKCPVLENLYKVFIKLYKVQEQAQFKSSWVQLLC